VDQLALEFAVPSFGQPPAGVLKPGSPRVMPVWRGEGAARQHRSGDLVVASHDMGVDVHPAAVGRGDVGARVCTGLGRLASRTCGPGPRVAQSGVHRPDMQEPLGPAERRLDQEARSSCDRTGEGHIAALMQRICKDTPYPLSL